jgi:hypothetical protein
MKQIETIKIWKNGESQDATILNAYIINDNLATSCSFYYQLCSSGEQPDSIGQSLAEGNVTIASWKRSIHRRGKRRPNSSL